MIDKFISKDTTKRSCWYYDNQMLDRMTSMSLHANTFRNASGAWVQYRPGAPGIDRGGYSMVPLCTSILSDDFQVTIANTWSDNGGDPVGTMWNSFSKPIAPYADFAAKAIKQIGAQADKWKAENEGKTGIAATVAKGASYIGKVAAKYGSTAADYMNANLISQGTRFTYYGGTGVSFGNLQMRFTIFPIWTSKGSFVAVQQQLEDLFPYVIGEYKPFIANIKYQGKGKSQTEIHESTDLLGWQMTPGGYRANFKDIDVAGMRGTLKLRIGAGYVLEGLLCENLNFNLSKQMVKKPEGAHYYGLTSVNTKDSKYIDHPFSPLFCDVVMTFKPATKYSDRAMRHFIYGINLGQVPKNANNTTDYATNEGANYLTEEMNASLSNIKAKLESVYKI